MSPLRKV